MTNTQALAKTNNLKQFLVARKTDLATILPDGISPDRVIRTALMAAMENPGIGQKCSAMSIYRSVVQATMMGLTVGNGYSEAYFVPYKGECTLRASYLGWAKVARRTEGVDLIRASVVYEHDTFEMSAHPPSMRHVPHVGKDRGEKIGAVAAAYTITRTADGRRVHDLYDFAYCTAEDVAKAREMSQGQVWAKWEDEMWKKTATRRLCKWLPSEGELGRLMRIEAGADGGFGDSPDPDIDTADEIAAMAERPADTQPEQAKSSGSRAQQLRGQMITDPAPSEDIEATPDYGPDDSHQGAGDDVPNYGEQPT